MHGRTLGGGILMNLASLWMVRLPPVEVFALFLAPCRQCRGLSFGKVILALPASDAVHLGVDSLNVVRHVGWLLGGTRALGD